MRELEQRLETGTIVKSDVDLSPINSRGEESSEHKLDAGRFYTVEEVTRTGEVVIAEIPTFGTRLYGIKPQYDSSKFKVEQEPYK